jgi:hypothetical protein
MKIIERLKAIKSILFAEEYFVSVANTKHPEFINKLKQIRKTTSPFLNIKSPFNTNLSK